jgi:branched-chain amino acid transport system substrate-binding protein
MAQNGDTVAGKKVELIVKDDTGLPDVTKRLAQELVVNDKVNVLAGFGITPLALAVAPIATQSKTPLVVMAAATSSITEASPYIVRTSFTLPQVSVAMATGRPRTASSRWSRWCPTTAPATTPRSSSSERFQLNGGKVIDKLRVPLRNPDFAPFLQKVRDAKPDALFVFVPSGAGAAVMKQFGARHGQGRHQADRHRRRDRRRPAERHGRRRAGRGHLAPLLGRAPVGREQEVRRGLPEGQQEPAPQLHGRGRL